jgi:5-(carboxyamino)imidazole ribonucleotide mutase
MKEYFTLFGIEHDFYVSSAHRNPEQTKNLVQSAENEGIRIIIAAAGMAAHLPGVVAAYTQLPVIGVPLTGPTLSGEDALYSVVQMPTGVPVATVAINGTKNAVILAAEIIALFDQEVSSKLRSFREKQSQ